VRTPVDWAVDRTRSTDAMLVTADRRRWFAVLAFDAAMFTGAVVAWALWPVTRDTWFGILGGCLIGLQIGRASIGGIRRASAYRAGWLNGRSAMVHALAEAQRRGMTPSEWLSGELARDYAVLGIDPLHDTPDDDAV
jgi:hypothetical protein